MAVREIVLLGDPVLRQKAKKIHRFDPSLQKLVNDMFETMHAADGAGLAAPQIGLLLRLFVVELDDEETGKHHKIAIANPEIVSEEGEQCGLDGCLSIPGYYGVNVRRAARVVMKGQDVRGKPLRVSADGYFAWALQHERDHLDGILYIDLLESPDDLRVARREEIEEEAGAIE
ncbi:MAG: peptide deformylase [Ktedonobacteraceae bacterium]|nr:peptide deformylase [Ktedonobacteraceae bacterium]